MLDDGLPPKTAVIVEDDPDVRHLLAEVLEAAGFSTVSVGNGIDGVRAVLTYQPLITTLDVNMPGIDGIEAARRIRAQSDTYIIMLTALDEEADVVLGLSAGADEYIHKPFRPRELRARIEAMLRRPRGGDGATPRQEQFGRSFPAPRDRGQGYASAGGAASDRAGEPGSRIAAVSPSERASGTDDTSPRENVVVHENGQYLHVVEPGTALVPHIVHGELEEGTWVSHRDLRLNADTRTVLVQEKNIELTRTEFDLLRALMESKRRVRSKADLTLVLRGESYVTSYFVGDADKRAIEAHMTNLRRKLGDNPVQPRYIETVRGVGYRLTTELTS
ncbi:response regulator transcription factor [Microbacterium sp. NPDC089987]|uniref:response regulator transcription factor n=1 Tax=Microbacterium sp. NPDC089987 TaxID=3364202 RepID=UPI00381C1D02